MKKYLFILLLPLTTFVKAQTILENQFQFNFLALNPAFAGSRETFSLNGMLGNQFNGTIRPQQMYQLFSMDGPVQQGQGGLALQAHNDNSNTVGFNNSGVKISYAYRKKFGDIFTLGLGANAGFIYQPIITTTLGAKQLFPYVGLGGLFSSERFFVSVSKPVLFINEAVILNNKKPFYSMLGFSLGEIENLMMNVSGLLETNKDKKANIFITAKVWVKKSVGVGVMYRSETNPLGDKKNKIIPMAEFQITDSFRLGASYDANPFSFPDASGSTPTTKRGGVLQLFLRYDFIRDDSNDSRLKYY
ncbi:PorP/SprF family type IX secretion system membrane protein [Emticicia sp. 17c]|uniref:PorP/SprF family type IX secretion system membrane protein n=1 Tax=Emticicia sp. 17c TaxID=3127704 RepID=UPI00301D1679